MKTTPRLTSRTSSAKARLETPTFDPRSLAYEDVVALATRLTQRGYTDLGKEFLAFANSPTGLAAFYRPALNGRKGGIAAHAVPEKLASIPYVVAAAMLLRSTTIQREAVSQAVLLIEFGKAHLKAREEDEPPMFTD